LFSLISVTSLVSFVSLYREPGLGKFFAFPAFNIFGNTLLLLEKVLMDRFGFFKDFFEDSNL
jgi:hypothetical protein